MNALDDFLLRAYVHYFDFDEFDEYGAPVVPPAAVITGEEALEELRAAIGTRLPRLYERLALTWRWPAVDASECSLLANPPGPGLSGLIERMRKDPALWETLIPAGFVQF